MESREHLMSVYAPQDVTFVRGDGPYLWDNKIEHLDFLAGISTINLGHSNPEIIDVIKSQAERLMHVSNGFQISQQIDLANKSLFDWFRSGFFVAQVEYK